MRRAAPSFSGNALTTEAYESALGHYCRDVLELGALTGALMDQASIKPNRSYNALYVYALP